MLPSRWSILWTRELKKRAGFFSRLWSEFKAQSVLKQTGLASGAAIAMIAIIGGVYSGFQVVRPLVAPAVAKSAPEPIERPRSLLNELNNGNVPSDFRAPQPRWSPNGR